MTRYSPKSSLPLTDLRLDQIASRPKIPFLLARLLAKLPDNLDGLLKISYLDHPPLILGHHSDHHPAADLRILSEKALYKLFIKGELGFAEAYLDGDWQSADLTNLFHFITRNAGNFKQDFRPNTLFAALNRFRHFLNRNSRKGSRKNIQFHYDLGNDFYDHWLDGSMTYSSALFDPAMPNQSLYQAQQNKYRFIADMAEICPLDHILEIGCGWGGFSQYVAEKFQCQIDGVTLSDQQLAYAQQRYRQADIAQYARASLTDYRDSQGQYDKIVSIEMFEAVGEENWDQYFQILQQRLKDDGQAVLQIITIDDLKFTSYRKNVDFIQRYIFPGGLLPSRSALENCLERNGFRLQDHLMFGKDYGKTCALWQQAFLSKWDQISQLGYDDRFKRVWQYYLSYCEAGFADGQIDVGCFKIVKA